MIKALIIDLDGTLLNSAKSVSTQDKETLIECKGKGLELYFATARPPLLETMLDSFDDIIRIFNGGIFYNGGLIKYDNICEYIYIEQEWLQMLLFHLLYFDDCNIVFQMKDECHSFRIPSDISIKSWGITQSNLVDFGYVINNLAHFKIIKILIFYGDITRPQKKLPNELINVLNECRNLRVYITDHQKVAQIMHRSASKENAINILCHHKSYKKENIAFFGDDEPDKIALLQLPYSIAMYNALEHIKKVAKFVTLDNDHSGVSYAIHNYLKIL